MLRSTITNPSSTGRNELIFDKPGAVQLTVINITYPVDLQPGSPDMIRSRIANTILGGYFNSRVNANFAQRPRLDLWRQNLAEFR
ncbi:MAG: hypothetical protein R2778_02235 [Saprospiraceae bacterium]